MRRKIQPNMVDFRIADNINDAWLFKCFANNVYTVSIALCIISD